MLYRDLGTTGFKASVISFGGAGLSGKTGGYGFGDVSRDEIKIMLKRSLELGINIFDTAPIYGFGSSEEVLGDLLPKDSFIITKAGVDWHDNQRVNMTNEPKVVEKMLHQSLKRLKRDCIDLYMIHWPDQNVDIRKSLEVLVEAQKKAQIRFIGLCNTNQNELIKAREVAKIDVIQSEHNYFNRHPFNEVKPFLKETKAAFMSWGTFDKGIITGRVKLDRKYEASDARSWAPWWKAQDLSGKLQQIDLLKEKLSELELSLLDFALLFQLSFEEVTTMLIGFKKVSDLEASVSALEKFKQFDLSRIKPLL